MNKLQLFEDIHALYVCNLLSYSEDYSMTQPKKEFVNEWKKEKKRYNKPKNFIQLIRKSSITRLFHSHELHLHFYIYETKQSREP